MGIKGFLKPTKIKIALFLIIFLFSPFIIVELGDCPIPLMYPPDSHATCPDKYSVSFHPLNTLMMLLQGLGIAGNSNLVFSGAIIVISKLIVSYIASCAILLLYHRLRNRSKKTI